MPDHFEYRLEREFARKKKAIEETLLADGAQDFPHYRYLTGQIYGINLCMQVLEELRADVLEEDRP